MMYGYGYGGPDLFVFHALSWIFWVVLIVAAIKFLRDGRGRGWRRGGWFEGDALNILKERFAKGEISKEEYEERKKVLMGEAK